MKIVYMIILMIYELGLCLMNNRMNKQVIDFKQDFNKDLRMINLLLIGIIPIAICIIGALG